MLRAIASAAAPAALVLCSCAAHATSNRSVPRIIPVASASAPVPASPAGEPAPLPVPPPKQPGTADVLLYDGDRQTDDANSKIIESDKIAALEQRRVLRLLFGRKYLTNESACNYELFDGVDAARRAGQFVPQVIQAALGAFTIPGEAQTLYVIGNWECGAGHGGSSATLAVLDSSGVVARANIPGGGSLGAVTDLDGDGVSEFLVVRAFMNMGITVESATLERFGKGKLVEVKAFGQVYEDNCGDIAKPRTKAFTVIRATPTSGAAPVFKMEKKKVPCPELGTIGSETVKGQSAR
jgi:hypothetical protein